MRGRRPVSFQPDANYAREMNSIGFSIDEESSTAWRDEREPRVRKQMKGEHLSDLDADKLIAFRISASTRHHSRFARRGLKISAATSWLPSTFTA
jgi:hypothetical protein